MTDSSFPPNPSIFHAASQPLSPVPLTHSALFLEALHGQGPNFAAALGWPLQGLEF